MHTDEPKQPAISSAFSDAEAELFARVATLEAERDELREAYEALRDRNTILEAESITDELTQLPNLKAIEEAIAKNVARYNRNETPCSVLFFDIDHFKWVNDLLGHPIGNLALQSFGKEIHRLLKRATDLVARYGGEEFVGLLEDCALDEAAAMAQRIRRAIEALEIEMPENYELPEKYLECDPSQRPQTYTRESDGRLILKITVSIGVVEMTSKDDTAATLKERADKALYVAKDNERNCICLYQPGGITFVERDANPAFQKRPHHGRVERVEQLNAA